VPIVVNWPRPKRTFEVIRKYLKETPYELWIPIIDYWIGELYGLRSDVEARRVNQDVLEDWKERQNRKFSRGGKRAGRGRRKG
jgi:hypothetical protein